MKMSKLLTMIIIFMTAFIPFSSSAEESTISADSFSSASGDITHASAGALATDINGNNVVIAQSMADAQGKEISLLSRAHATGKIVHGEGKVTVTGEATQSSVEALTEKIKEGLYSVTVIVTGHGSSSDGGASGNTYALAWAVDPPQDPKDPEQPVEPKVVITYQPFFGYIFGKSDAERYYAFKYQIVKHYRLATNETNDTVAFEHAVYWRDIILDDYGLNASQFEHKYTLQEVIRLNPDLAKPINNSK